MPGPTVIPNGVAPGLMPVPNSLVTVPAGVMTPILSAVDSVNQRLPSGPVTMPAGPAPTVRANSVTAPAGVTWPILLAPGSVYQKFPSGPVVIPCGAGAAVLSGNSVTTAGTHRSSSGSRASRQDRTVRTGVPAPDARRRRLA